MKTGDARGVWNEMITCEWKGERVGNKGRQLELRVAWKHNTAET